MSGPNLDAYSLLQNTQRLQTSEKPLGPLHHGHRLIKGKQNKHPSAWNHWVYYIGLYRPGKTKVFKS